MLDAELKIRPATADDLPSVLALYGQPALDNGNILPIDRAKEIFDRFAAYPDYTLYVVERGGMIVATFALLVMDNLGHLGAPSGVVEDVVVAADFQGFGIGTAMMTFAVDRCREKGCYKLTLSSNMKRERAHAFYEGIGFTRHGYSFRTDLPEQTA
jgi:GNAT superfamily N-acetyltransferase